jgi:peptidylprolyl isomerase
MYGKWKVLLVAIILSALVLGCTAPAEKTVKAGDLVYVDYTLKDTNGNVVETTNATVARANNMYNPANPYAPFSFVVGSNTTIAGFDEAVRGMKLNESKKNVTLTPDKAYGDYNASRTMTMPLETITGNNTNFSLFLNQTIMYNGEYIFVAGVGPANNTAKIVPLSNISTQGLYTIIPDLQNNTATLDYNHPMAGKTLIFDITIVAINPSPSPKL